MDRPDLDAMIRHRVNGTLDDVLIRQIFSYIEALEARNQMFERAIAMMYVMPNYNFMHSQEQMRAFLREAFLDIEEMVKRQN